VVKLIFFALRKAAASPAGRQSTALALLSALGIAIAGAVVWGLIARQFNVQLSLIGVLIGAGIGYVVAKFRPGHLPTILAGVVIAVFGCALGTFLAIMFTLLSGGYTLAQITSNLDAVFRAYPTAVGGLGFVFWLFAALAAFRVPWQSQRLAARRGAVPPGPSTAAGYGAAPGYGRNAGYGTTGYGSAADGFGSVPAGGQGADLGLPPFTDPGLPPFDPGPAGSGAGPSGPV
jgi:hypothetical protein